MSTELRHAMRPLLYRIIGDVADLLVLLTEPSAAVVLPEICPAPPVVEPIVIVEETPAAATTVAETPRENIPGPGKTRCSKCGVAGHNSRSCGRAPKGNPHGKRITLPTEPAAAGAVPPATPARVERDRAPAPSSSSSAAEPYQFLAPITDTRKPRRLTDTEIKAAKQRALARTARETARPIAVAPRREPTSHPAEAVVELPTPIATFVF